MHPGLSVDFASAPFLVIWETTQACDLSCTHCRASAQPQRHPDELTTAEGEALLDDVAAMGTPVFILSGGDPVKRPDLLRLIRHGKRLGLRMGTIPAATATLSEDLVRRPQGRGPRPDGAEPRLPARRAARRLPRRPRRLRQDDGGGRVGAPVARCRCRSTPPCAAARRPT